MVCYGEMCILQNTLRIITTIISDYFSVEIMDSDGNKWIIME